jgi:serine/threonine-protein kinase
MGEVYRATDTRLKRQVAIKILPASFADDPDRLARFQREAEVLASLNHPNIAAIYGLEGPFDSPRSIPGLAQGGPEGIGPFLVLELVEGLTLAEVIDGARAKGGLPLDDALSMARQIADALAAAHGQGIVHRDLKPANIKVRPDGTIKVLDFGLAKALESDPASSTSSHAPTLTSPAMTRLGVILGTAAYMSPEQARGKPADKRADIWAFGVVLFEMLSGTRLFTGSEVSDTLAFVLTKDPDWSLLPPSTPAPIRTLLRRCLQKDRTKRLADIADARLEIDDVLAGTNTETQPTVAPVRAQSRGARLLPWAVAGAAASAAVVMLGLWAPWRSEPLSGPVRFSASVGVPVIIDPGQGGSLAVSPDGSMVAFVGRAVGQTGQLYVRRLGELEARAIPGTDGAAMPFFSPDGQWVAGFDGASVKKVTAAGGAVGTLQTVVVWRSRSATADRTISGSTTSRAIRSSV